MRTQPRSLCLLVAGGLFGLSLALILMPDVRSGWLEGLLLLLMIGNLALSAPGKETGRPSLTKMSIQQMFESYREGKLAPMFWWQSVASVASVLAVVVLAMTRL